MNSRDVPTEELEAEGRCTRGNQYRQRWDDWEAELARQLRESGLLYREISEKLEIPTGTLRKWCTWHGRAESLGRRGR